MGSSGVKAAAGASRLMLGFPCALNMSSSSLPETPLSSRPPSMLPSPAVDGQPSSELLVALVTSSSRYSSRCFLGNHGPSWTSSSFPGFSCSAGSYSFFKPRGVNPRAQPSSLYVLSLSVVFFSPRAVSAMCMWSRNWYLWAWLWSSQLWNLPAFLISKMASKNEHARNRTVEHRPLHLPVVNGLVIGPVTQVTCLGVILHSPLPHTHAPSISKFWLWKYSLNPITFTTSDATNVVHHPVLHSLGSRALAGVLVSLLSHSFSSTQQKV